MVKRKGLELDQLLARGRLSGRQYDEIEREIIERVAPRQKRWPWPGLATTAAAFALGAWLLLSSDTLQGPTNFPEHTGSPIEDTVLVKGATSAAGDASEGASRARTTFDVGCGREPPRVCRLGDTLTFTVAGRRSGYVSAYAERIGEPAASRIWYFPASNGVAPRVEARAVTSALPDGIRLGPPHAPGRYRVTAWLSLASLGRTEADLEAEPLRAQSSTITFEIVD